ncbi:GNAT family N-acetyltransferase [Vibrio sp.]|uniref:GNAT family N-acetyltransferase n=1 Tax=Vibrio sp. TaxID=678 RepID=UPI00311E4441
MNLVAKPINNNHQDYEKLRKWRDNYIGFNPANEANFRYWELIRDEFSYSFAFHYQGQLVGSVRFTPLGHGITMGERQLDIMRFVSSPLKTLEVNRLVIDKKARGKGIMHESLSHCFNWIFSNTTHQNLIALCSPRMVPLYHTIGAKTIGYNIGHETNKTYSLINIKLKDLNNVRF